MYGSKIDFLPYLFGGRMDSLQTLFSSKWSPFISTQIKDYGMESSGVPLIKEGSLSLHCCQYMALMTTDTTLPTYREKPYGIVCITIEVDLKENTASEYWQIIEVFDSSIETIA